MAPKPMTNGERMCRILSRTSQVGDCLLYQGALADGYAHIGLSGKRWYYAHVFMFEVLIGPIPMGLELDHLCRNRSCVNPAHLEPVTHRENCVRGVGFVSRKASQTTCMRGHELAGGNLYSWRGHRYCKKCRAMQQARRREAQSLVPPAPATTTQK